MKKKEKTKLKKEKPVLCRCGVHAHVHVASTGTALRTTRVAYAACATSRALNTRLRSMCMRRYISTEEGIRVHTAARKTPGHSGTARQPMLLSPPAMSPATLTRATKQMNSSPVSDAIIPSAFERTK